MSKCEFSNRDVSDGINSVLVYQVIEHQKLLCQNSWPRCRPFTFNSGNRLHLVILTSCNNRNTNAMNRNATTHHCNHCSSYHYIISSCLLCDSDNLKTMVRTAVVLRGTSSSVLYGVSSMYYTMRSHSTCRQDVLKVSAHMVHHYGLSSQSPPSGSCTRYVLSAFTWYPMSFTSYTFLFCWGDISPFMPHVSKMAVIGLIVCSPATY